ncbi:alpha/beta fold hydrolase [Salinispira pacifica]|uniref:AB hydrolase-1 domain-containing protein n=1 Tax=Salinispira pacifica TaxID=1307761 RepID=V5WJH3_9SPIO|nr:alpha/beta hydrolase [Salinispira pacifica]AHC15923.1 hypothetical protein L21SP2_2571 [Salinispira pacifica]
MHSKMKKPHLLLLHNGFQNAGTWDALLPRLSDLFHPHAPNRHGYDPHNELVFPDSGAGETLDSIESGRLELEQWIKNNIPEDEEYFIWGHCLGGAIASAYASTAPRGLRGMLCEACGFFSNETLAHKAELLVPPFEELPPEIQSSFREQHGHSRAERLWKIISTHRDSYIMNPDYSILNILEKIEVPVILWQGDRDPYFTPQHSRRALTHLQRGRLQIEPGGKHDMHNQFPLKGIDLVRDLPD